MRRLLVLLLALSVSSPASATSFSGLGPDDHVEVTLQSSGCFHNFTGSVKIFGGELPYSEGTLSMPHLDMEQSEVVRPLSPEDLAALDEYVRVLRDDWQIGYCTTTQTLVLRWYSKGLQVHVETLRDSSCAAGLRFVQPAYNILGLSELLSEPGPDPEPLMRWKPE